MLKIDAPVCGSVMHLRTFSSTMYPLKGKKKSVNNALGAVAGGWLTQCKG